VDGELVLFNSSTELYFGLNACGSFIWKLLAESQPVSDIVAALLRRYEIDETAASAEVLVPRAGVSIAPRTIPRSLAVRMAASERIW